nr:hypothetical protein CFP56_05051 [Quercus suber]
MWRSQSTELKEKYCMESISKDERAIGIRITVAGEAGVGGVLWRLDDAFAQVIGVERGGHVQGLSFGPTLSGTHTRNMEDCTPPSTSTAIDQKVKELTAEV